MPFRWEKRRDSLSALLEATRRRIGEFDRTGRAALLLDALVLSASDPSVSLTPNSVASRELFLSNLGICLRSRFERDGRLAHLDAAVDVLREAIASTPPFRPVTAMAIDVRGCR